MNGIHIRYITIIVLLLFGMYGIYSFLLGDFTPLIILVSLFLFFTVNKWGSLGVLGVLLFKESAFQIPIPGQPDLWHVCGILAIIGGFIDIVKRGGVVRQSPVGALTAFSLVLCVLLAVNVILILPFHDIAFKNLIMHSAGRRYLKFALIYLIPVAVYLNVYRMDKMEAIIKWSYFLGLTYITIEVILKFAPQYYPYANLLFKASHDALAYAGITEIKGFQRYSGIATAGISIASFLLLARKNFSFSKVSIPYWILMLICFGCCALGGSRAKIILIPMSCFLVLWFCRKFKAHTFLLSAAGAMIAITLVYTQYAHLPGAMQRVFTVLPGLQEKAEDYNITDTQAFDNGRDEWRDLSRSLLGEYWWKGIGYKYLQSKDNYSKRASVEGVKSLAKYDLGLATPILMFGLLYFILVSMLLISTIWLAFSNMLMLRRRGILESYGRLLMITITLIFARIFFICTQTGYHKYFVELPVTILIIIVILRKALYIYEKEESARLENIIQEEKVPILKVAKKNYYHE